MVISIAPTDSHVSQKSALHAVGKFRKVGVPCCWPARQSEKRASRRRKIPKSGCPMLLTAMFPMLLTAMLLSAIKAQADRLREEFCGSVQKTRLKVPQPTIQCAS